MPRGDKTGPQGQGPMTGRAVGPCAGYPSPGYLVRGRGRRMGRGMGRGFGWCGMCDFPINAWTVTEKEEKEILKGEKEALQSEIKEIEKRQKELGQN